MYKEKEHEPSGITLIALVVTIIILIILATITLRGVFGEGGLIQEAKGMKQNTDKEISNSEEELSQSEQEYLNAQVFEAATIFSITFMVGGVAYKTIQATKVTFPSVDPTREGYNFMGWYYDEATTNKATTGETISQDTNLYAGWALNGVVNYVEIDGSLPYYDSEDDLLNDPNGYEYTWALVGELYNGSFILGKIDYTKEAEEQGYQINSTIKSYELVGIENVPTSGTGDWNTHGEEGGPWITVQENGLIKITPWCFDAYDGMGIIVKVTWEDGTTITYNIVCREFYCLAEGTMITLANRSRKAIENIEYTDNLLVWDFDNGCFAEAKPLWIKKKQVAQKYNYVKFDNGTVLKTVADHRIFNIEKQKFTYTMNEEDTPIGTTTFIEDGTTTKLVERKVVEEVVNYYNIITDYHMNLFADGILTSLRLNNLYKIENMKFVKDDRKLANREEFAGIPDKYYYGLRLAEQPKEINNGNDVKHTKTLVEYVERIMKMAK